MAEPIEDDQIIRQPGCSEPNEQVECFIGMPGEKPPDKVNPEMNNTDNYEESLPSGEFFE